jgi:hypothetical protein
MRQIENQMAILSHSTREKLGIIWNLVKHPQFHSTNRKWAKSDSSVAGVQELPADENIIQDISLELMFY